MIVFVTIEYYLETQVEYCSVIGVTDGALSELFWSNG